MSKTIWILSGVLVVVLVATAVVFYMANHSTKTATSEPVITTIPDTTTTTAPTPAPAATTTKTTTWKVGGVAVTGTYADADTVKLADNSYRMYYSIQPEVKGNNFEVYSSTSTDGVTWTKESGTRKTMATFPDVIPTNDGYYRMYFQSAGVIKSATSTDGLTWKDEAGTRIDKTNDLGLTFDNVAAPTVFMQADATVKPFYGYVMVYRGTINTPYVGETVPNKNTQILLWATSDDGLAWTKRGLAIDSRNTTLYGLADGPELFTSEDGSVTLSFWSYTGVYWSTFKDGAFSAPEKVFALAESTAMNKFPAATPGDPVYAKFNGTWYMYYGRPDGINYATSTTQ